MDLSLLKMDRYQMNPGKDALFRGEFEVIKELVADLGADGEASKRECDKVIDKNGPPNTGGTGIKQLRENIAESKLSYEIMDDAAQVFLKSKIMDNIHKYYYLICFTAYMREAAEAAMTLASEEDKTQNVSQEENCQPQRISSRLANRSLSSWKTTLLLETLLKMAKVSFNGKETFPETLSQILRILPTLTSKQTSVELSTISTRQPTLCLATCPKETTRKGPSIDSRPRHS